MGKQTTAFELVQRASARSATIMHWEFRRGIDSIASIAATAPLVGMLGTMIGILTGFTGAATEKSSFIFATAERFSEALGTSARGLFVGLLAFGLHRYISAKVESFDLEMRAASSDLANELSRVSGRR